MLRPKRQPDSRWRLGLFRIHGKEPDREYLSLMPTQTPAPDFHQPGRWAFLTLAD